MIKIWPWSEIRSLKKDIDQKAQEIEAMKVTIQSYDDHQNMQFEKTISLQKENSQLKKHIVEAAKVVEKKEEDFKRTIAFMKLQNFNS